MKLGKKQSFIFFICFYMFLMSNWLLLACGDTSAPSSSLNSATPSLAISTSSVLVSSTTNSSTATTNATTLSNFSASISTPTTVPTSLTTQTSTFTENIKPSATSVPNPTLTTSGTTDGTESALQTRQVGAPNCCQAFNFAADGRLYFYDKPQNGKAGTYTLDVQASASQAQFLSSSFGFFSPDLSLVAQADSAKGTTTIAQVADGAKRAALQNSASPTLISPDKTQVAYLLRSTNQDSPEAPQRFDLWVGKVDGTGLHSVWSLREGANLAWFPHSSNLLLTARDASNQRFGLWVINTTAPVGQNAKLIVESKGLIAASLSSDGNYMAYAIAFEGAANSGVWVANADGTNSKKLDWIGGWRWSLLQPQELFYIPAVVADSNEAGLWAYDFQSGQSQHLVSTPLAIISDQWQVSPADNSLVYRNSKDNSLWFLRFR
jgi:hypothetical protein